MKLFDFRCQTCRYKWEAVAVDENSEEFCPKCSDIAQPIISSVNFRLNGADPAFPTASERWAKRHERAAREANE